MDRVLSFIAEHPELAVTLFVTVGWPLLTGLASFLDERIARHAPMLQALLRSSGFDAKRAIAVVLSIIAKRYRLTTPPEVLEAATRRAEEKPEKRPAANDNDDPPPPAAPSGLVYTFSRRTVPQALAFAACLAGLTLTGCGASMDGPKTIVNGAHDTLVATEPVLREHCTAPAEAIARDPAATQAQADEVRDNLVAMGCPELATAYDSLRTGFLVGHATITATEAGACVGVSRSVEGCNVPAAMLEIGTAAAEVADKAARLKGGAR